MTTAPTTGIKAVRPAAFKADTGNSGQYEAIVSVFNNVDYVGDVVEPGAYADGLEQWKASGNPMPVIWSHQWSDPDYHIGYTLDAKELLPGDPALPEELKALGGLWTSNQLDMDAPKAKQVFRLLKGRRVKQFSFHYDVLEATYGKADGETVRFLKKLFVNETGPTLLGVNGATTLLGTKADDGALTAEEVKALRAILLKNQPEETQATALGPDEKSQPSGPRRVEDVALRIALAEHGLG